MVNRTIPAAIVAIPDLVDDNISEVRVFGWIRLMDGSEKRDGKLVLLPPRRAFVDEHGSTLRLNDKRVGGSGHRKLCAVDWDGDGKLDLLANSANATFLRQIAAHDGVWVFKDMGNLDKKNIEGHDVSPAVTNFDGDGIPDFIGGAEDGHLYFLKNPRAPK